MIQFEWDPRKASLNEKKHGVAFEVAITVWDDPFFLDIHDRAHSQIEERFIRIGRSDFEILVVVYTARPGRKIRFISARRASRKERRLYHETNKKNRL